MNQKRFAPITILLIIVGILVVVGGGYYTVKKFQKPTVRVCTQEAKQCPDGSYVGRTGPKCEFAVCPETEADKTVDWKTYRNEKYGFEIKYPNNSNPNFESIDYTDLEDLIKHDMPTEFSSGDLLFSGSFGLTNNIPTDSGLYLMCADYNIRIDRTSYSDITNWVEYRRKQIETPSNYEGIIISGKLLSVENITIQDKIGKKLTIKGGWPFYTAQFGIINNGRLYTISFNDFSLTSKCLKQTDEQENNQYKDFFENLISSFKFL